MLTKYGDTRLRADNPKGTRLDFSLEPDADKLCMQLADDPDRDLSPVSSAMIVMLRARLIFAIGACMTQPSAPLVTVPDQTSDELVLRLLLGELLAQTRLPPEWRPQ
jgi:hypothetical protein